MPANMKVIGRDGSKKDGGVRKDKDGYVVNRTILGTGRHFKETEESRDANLQNQLFKKPARRSNTNN